MMEMYEPIEEPMILEEVITKPTREDPFSVLLVGLDGNGQRGSRADVIMVATINPKTNEVTLVSIPRDTYTEIIGRGQQDKINHAYAFGEIKMLKDSVESFLDIRIDYYISLNMYGFRDLIDTVGGVTVENKFSFTEQDIYYPEGEITLNGQEALWYVRMRQSDPNGDLGRNERQRQVLKEIVNQSLSFSSITKINDMLHVVGKNVRTNLTGNDLFTLSQSINFQSYEINTLSLSGEVARLDRIWYFIVDESERENISNQLKKQLHLES